MAIEAGQRDGPTGAREDLAGSGLRTQRRPSPLVAVARAEDVVHFIVAALLLVLAVYVLYRTTSDFVDSARPFADQVTSAVNGVLFVIIVLELVRTVMAHFEEAGFQLKPFLVIGIISAVRHILTVGAQLSLGSERSGDVFRRAQIELGVSSGVVLTLVVGLILVHGSGAAED